MNILITLYLALGLFHDGAHGGAHLKSLEAYDGKINAILNAAHHKGEYFLLEEGGVIKVFDHTKQVRTIAEQGTQPGQLQEPTWLAVFEGDLYVLQKPGKISVFSTDGEFMGDINLQDPSGDLNFVNGLYLHNGDFLVTFDKGGFVKRYKRHGELVGKITGFEDPYKDHMLNILDMDFSTDGKTAYLVNQFDGALITVDLKAGKVTGVDRYPFPGVDQIVNSFLNPPDPDSPISFTRAKVFYPLQEKQGKPIVISRLKEKDGKHVAIQFKKGEPERSGFHMEGLKVKPTYMEKLGELYLVVDMSGNVYLTKEIF